MTRRALAAALSIAALAGCRASGERKGMAFMPEMFESVSWKPYDPNPATRSGQTLLPPPEGAVPLEARPFAYGPGPDEARRAGRELGNPLAAGGYDGKRGRKVFETVCIVCHGPRGEGDGPIIGRFPNPPSLQADRAKRLPDGQVFHIITRGQGIMPAHAAQVRPEDRWQVVSYLRELQGLTPANAAGGRP